MPKDYGPTVVMVVGMFAVVAVLFAGFILPLLTQVGMRIADVAS